MSDGQRPGDDDPADDRPAPQVPRPEYPGPDAEASGVPPWPTHDYPTPPPPPGEQPTTGYQHPAPPAGWRPAPPNHPDANTAMVLGIVGVAGGFICFLPIVMAPFAWVMGARVVREVDASNGALGGRSEGQAGKIMGIIGTVLLVLGILAIAAFVALLIAFPESFEEA